MALEKHVEIYEILVRYEQGGVKGAHARDVERLVDSDTGDVVHERVEPARAVTLDELATLVANEHAECLTQLEAAKSEITTLQQDVEASNEAVSERDSALAKVAELEAQLNPADEEGFPVLTPVQLMLGLVASGVTKDNVNAAIDNIEDATQRETARAYWERSTSYSRSHPLIDTFAGLLSLSSDQVDQMWQQAAQSG